MKFPRSERSGFVLGLLFGVLLPFSAQNAGASAYFLQGNDWNVAENWYDSAIPSGARTYVGRGLTALVDAGHTNYAELLFLGLTDGFLWGDEPGEKIYLAGLGSVVVRGTLNTAHPYIGEVVFDEESGLVTASARGSLTVAGGSLSYGYLDQAYGDYIVSSGTVDSGDTRIGTANGFNVTATISSTPDSTTVFNAGFGSAIHVGCARNNSHLSVSGSNTTVNSNVYVGEAPDSVGTATISEGARLNGSVSVGASGTGTLDIQTGATVVGDGNIGTAAGSHGTVNVQTGGTWDAGGISVGISGTGVLNINGGNVTSSYWSTLGSSDGSLGVVNVTTGTWTHSTSLAVGYDGTGILNINGGAVIANSENSAFYIASPTHNPSSQGTVNVTAGELKTRYLYVGNGGSAELNISGGTVATSVDAAVGDDSTANVTGGSWGIDGNLSVSSYTEGMASLNVGGGTVNVFGTTSVGQGQDSRGTANVTDGELRTASLSVGAQGTGELDISGGRVITDSHAIIGGKDIGYSYYWDASWYEGNGTVNVTGGSWEVGGDIILGSEHHVYLDAYTTGTLNVDDGTVSASNIYVGKYGAGILDIDAGTINVSGQIVVAEYAGSHGILNYNGGTLNASSIVIGAGSATVNFNQPGATTVDFGLTGNLDVNVNANGTTTLTTENTYTGKTSINAGTLVLAPGATINNSAEINLGTSGEQGTLDVSAKSDFSIGSGQRLSGYGTVNLGEGKTLTIYGILSPGNSPGVTSVVGDAELDAISTTLMELAGIGGVAGVDFDQFEVSGLLTYGGDLSIQGFSGYDITQTAVYQLFDFAQENGDFHSVTVGTTGLVLDNGIWAGSDAMANYTFSQASGIFSVVSVPEPGAVALVGFSVIVLLLRRRHNRLPLQTEVSATVSQQ